MAIQKILSADIGGTNGRFAYFSYEVEAKKLELVKTHWISLGQLEEKYSKPTLIAILSQLDFGFELNEFDVLVIAVACPITERKLKLTNNLLTLDLDELEANFKCVRLLNDFVAQACSCLSDLKETSRIIQLGKTNPNSPIAVVGAGTGFGKAYIVPNQNAPLICSAEGGQAAFAMQSREEMEFAEFVKDRLGVTYPNYDNIVSGLGLTLLHEFLTGEKLKPQEIAAQFTNNPKLKTLEWFSGFYGRAGRNYVLETLALGGLFISGGIAIKNPIIISHEAFRANFIDSKKCSKLLQEVPIRLLTNEASGLWGAAEFWRLKQLNSF
ncbi:MAG: glucokinase [Deltaproteobacteria bacterium]|nr:glucokinase [Deltaproteobacteria bacterium]